MRLLIVEDDPSSRQIAGDILEDSVYEVEMAATGDDGARLIEEEEWDLVLLDIMLPGRSGFDLLEISKKLHPFTPVVMFTALKDRSSKLKAYEMGVDDFIVKPYDRWEFLARVRSLLRLSRVYQKLEESKNIVVALAHAVEAKDPLTHGHSERVAEVSRKIALALGFSEETASDIYWAGILHDVGKIGVPLEILTKPSALTDEEYDKVKKHPEIACRICQGLRTLKNVIPSIRHHHERWDGGGYPDGLKGKNIPAEARIMAVADSYDAMTSRRTYRDAMPVEKAVSILREGMNSQWQPEVVETLIDILKDENIIS